MHEKEYFASSSESRKLAECNRGFRELNGKLSSGVLRLWSIFGAADVALGLTGLELVVLLESAKTSNRPNPPTWSRSRDE